MTFFFSDNGGYGPATDMDPLWGYKGTYYEGGIRVPFFVHWPGVVRPGRRSQEPIIGVDLYPTFLEIAGARLTAGQPSDGKSLVPLLRGESKEPDLKWLAGANDSFTIQQDLFAVLDVDTSCPAS